MFKNFGTNRTLLLLTAIVAALGEIQSQGLVSPGVSKWLAIGLALVTNILGMHKPGTPNTMAKAVETGIPVADPIPPVTTPTLPVDPNVP